MNDDGSPKILYHQTNADFTEFDVGRQGAGYNDSEMPSGVYMKEFPDTIKLGSDYKGSIIKVGVQPKKGRQSKPKQV